MYGFILVEPEGGLPEVDRDFYVMQCELYTTQPFGVQAEQEMDYETLISERPKYFLFNGTIGALTKAHRLRCRPRDVSRRPILALTRFLMRLSWRLPRFSATASPRFRWHLA